jgi:hypothetical protein
MITSEVEKLTMKGAVRKVGKFISKIFLVPKRMPLSDLFDKKKLDFFVYSNTKISIGKIYECMINIFPN